MMENGNGVRALIAGGIILGILWMLSDNMQADPPTPKPRRSPAPPGPIIDHVPAPEPEPEPPPTPAPA